MSPEQCQGLPAGPASDVYSLGGGRLRAADRRAPVPRPDRAVDPDGAPDAAARAAAPAGARAARGGRGDAPRRPRQGAGRAAGDRRRAGARARRRARRAGGGEPDLDRLAAGAGGRGGRAGRGSGARSGSRSRSDSRSDATTAEPIGRERELETLAELAAAAAEGSGHLVTIGGEPGTGKSTLLSAFVRRARGQLPEALVGLGRAAEHFASAEPYSPFLDALGRAAREPGARRSGARADGGGADLGGALPGARDPRRRRRAARGAAQPRPHAARVRGAGRRARHRAARSCWRSRTCTGPIRRASICSPIWRRACRSCRCWWSPPTGRPTSRSSATRCAACLRTLAQGSLRLAGDRAGAFRPRRGGGLSAPRAGRGGARRARRLRAAPHGGQSALPARDGQSPGGERRGRARGRGAAAGALAAVARADRAGGDRGGDPSEGGAAGRERSGGCSRPRASRGRRSRRAVAAHLVEEEEADVEDRLRRLAARHRLVDAAGEIEYPDGSSSQRFRFAHSLYQHAFYDELAPKRRELWHRRAAEELERLHAPRPAGALAQLAVHWEKGREFRRAIEKNLAAADVAAWRNPKDARPHPRQGPGARQPAAGGRGANRAGATAGPPRPPRRGDGGVRRRRGALRHRGSRRRRKR